MISTKKEHVKVLCKTIVTKLENQKSISFPPRLRSIVFEEVHQLVGPYIMSEEDLRERSLQKVGGKAEALEDAAFTESDAYKAARSIVKNSFGDDVLNGFYFLKPLKLVAGMIVSYLMRSPSIDEVYETDEDLEKMIVEWTKGFSADNIH
jgi:hypothetical protein